MRTTYAAEPAKVMKSEKSGAGLDDDHANKFFWFQREYTYLRGVRIPRTTVSRKVGNHTHYFFPPDIYIYICVCVAWLCM